MNINLLLHYDNESQQESACFVQVATVFCTVADTAHTHTQHTHSTHVHRHSDMHAHTAHAHTVHAHTHTHTQYLVGRSFNPVRHTFSL